MTAADYAAIAVAPVLIFLMISSLANFLMLVFYHGPYPLRVAWIVLMFTMGFVGIARIAIEQDRAYSLGYAAVLGIAGFISMSRFVGSPIFCAFILGVIAYLADRIVDDCTLIDDSIDSSGQGLVDFGRKAVKKQIELARKAQRQSDAEPAAKDPEPVGDDEAQVKHRRGGRGRKSQPGRTVMYLALAALPLFGLGQFMLRSDPATWQRAQWLLAVYLFSSFSLLVTTSFLGLRRYLRQRGVDMPANVSIGWLAGGIVMTAAIISLAYFVPMPGQAIASVEMPDWLDSPDDFSASRYGWGKEGAGKSKPGDASTPEDTDSEGKQTQGIKSEKGAPPGDSGDGNRKDGPTGKQQGGKKSAGGKSSAESKSQQSQSQKSQSQQSQSQQSQSQQSQSQQSQSQTSESQSSESRTSASKDSKSQKSQSQTPRSRESQSGESKSESDGSERGQQEKDRSPQPSDQNRSDSSQSQSNDDQPDDQSKDSDGKNDPNSQPNQRNKQDAKSEQQSQSDSSRSESSPSSSSGSRSMLGGLFSLIGGLLKFLLVIMLAGIVAGYLWIHRDAIAKWWNRLFDRPDSAKENATPSSLEIDASAPPRPFSSFRNPIGREKDPRRVMVITFQAFEAWTREQGWTREKDETPTEFMNRVAGSLPQMSTAANSVVAAYNRIVYGRGRPTQSDIDAAKAVWQAMG